jgi:phosphate transport system protein
MTKQIEKKLNDIHSNVIKMGSLVEENIDIAIESMKTENYELALKCEANDDVIDLLENEIEDQCLAIIATQNPVGNDLRKIFSILKVITDLERIGDNGVNIANVILEMKGTKFYKPLEDLPQMARLVKKMIYASINSFIDENYDLAIKTAQIDNEVDEMYENIYNELIDHINTNKEHKDQVIKLLLIGRYLERMADHATNICERTVYLVKGEKVKF